MAVTDFGAPLRSLGVGLLIALALAGTGCGDDDSDSGNGGPSAAAVGSDEAAVQTAFEQMRDALAEKDAKSACAVMATQPRREFAQMAGAKGGTCEEGFDTYIKGGITEDTAPELRAITVKGKAADVTAKATTSKKLQHAVFVKENGEWKVGTWLRD